MKQPSDRDGHGFPVQCSFIGVQVAVSAKATRVRAAVASHERPARTVKPTLGRGPEAQHGRCHQPLHAFIRESRAGKIALDDLEAFAQSVELAQMPIDRESLWGMA